MKSITLLRLTLHNFKGFSFSFAPEGRDADIWGRNATGKTTIADSFSWLLFDKDSLGRSDFEIKNINATGGTEHGLDHSVEGELSVNGIAITLKKVYREIWTKKRGSPQAVYTGNTTDYFIDGVPCQKKEYVARVAELAGDESIFRLLTTPSAFPALHWQKQRALLLEICGDLSDADVIDADSKLAPLLEILGKRSIDDHRKVIAARRAEINKELERIPVRIDECARSMPDVEALNVKQLRGEMKETEIKLNDAKLRLAGIDTGGAIAELSRKLQTVAADIAARERHHYDNAMKSAARIAAKIDEVRSQVETQKRDATEAAQLADYEAKRLAVMDSDLARLREKWAAVYEMEFQDTTQDTCPACGQALPAERVADAREKALAEFHRQRAENLTGIEASGKALAEERRRCRERMEKLQGQAVATVMEVPDLEKLIAEREALRKSAEEYASIPGYAALIAARDELQEKIQAEKDGTQTGREGLRDEIATLETQLSVLHSEVLKFTQRSQAEDRIEQLKTEEKKLAEEFERLEKELYLTEQFVRTKVKLLTEKINSRFQVARFILFETQVNGALAECCQIAVNGVPYNSNLNSGARINAGLDVCRTLMHHYGLMVPVFVDNAETVCDLIQLDTQMLRLIVSENDTKLRVETSKRHNGRLPGMEAA